MKVRIRRVAVRSVILPGFVLGFGISLPILVIQSIQEINMLSFRGARISTNWIEFTAAHLGMSILIGIGLSIYGGMLTVLYNLTCRLWRSGIEIVLEKVPSRYRDPFGH